MAAAANIHVRTRCNPPSCLDSVASFLELRDPSRLPRRGELDINLIPLRFFDFECRANSRTCPYFNLRVERRRVEEWRLASGVKYGDAQRRDSDPTKHHEVTNGSRHRSLE